MDKKRIFEIISVAEKGDKTSKILDISIILVITINVAAIIIGTFNISSELHSIFWHIEVVSVLIFTIEYLLRLWTASLLYTGIAPAKAMLRYAFSFMAIIDLLAILPFYIPFIIPIDLRVLRMLRVIRLFRLFKVHRYTGALSVVADVLKKKAAQLISSLFVILLLLVITSVLMYNIEHPAQPDVFKNAFSGLWWSVATFTTVGYGDIYPITTMGKIFSSLIAFLGIGLVAVPTGIISAGFVERISEERKAHSLPRKFCPYCGERLE